MLGRSITSTGNANILEEELVGTKNGINTVFTISYSPAASTFVLFQNGIKINNLDYELDSTTITVDTAPQSDDLLTCLYSY